MSKELRCPYCNDLITENYVEDMGEIVSSEVLYETEYSYTCPECNNESYINIYEIKTNDNSFYYDDIKCYEIIDMVADIGKGGEITEGIKYEMLTEKQQKYVDLNYSLKFNNWADNCPYNKFYECEDAANDENDCMDCNCPKREDFENSSDYEDLLKEAFHAVS